ncbi:MAG: PAS domain S-box protein [Anaerolineales bacterium]|nr:PAS domain S-box protein [Anaerolineales bacterium]
MNAQKLQAKMNLILEFPKDLQDGESRQKYITRAVFLLTSFGLLSALILSVLLGLLVKTPIRQSVFLLFGMGGALALGGVITYTRYWKAARFFPPLIFILTGAHLTIQPNLEWSGALQFTLAVIITAILFNTRAQWLTVAFGEATFLLINWFWKLHDFETILSYGLVLGVCLGGVATLQWFLSELLQRALRGLRQEIEIRSASEAELRQKESILAATAESAQLLLASTNWREHINKMLATLGTAANASHAYLFENSEKDGKFVTSQTYEWTAEGQAPEIDNPEYQNTPLIREGEDKWREALNLGKPFYNSTKIFSPSWAKDSLSRQGIKTLLDVPIFVEGKWWGIIGFDDYLREKPWSQVEVDALQISARLLGSAIKNQLANEELLASEDKFQAAFHGSFVPMVIGRLSDRVMIDANEAFLRLIGYSRAETILHTAQELNLWAVAEEHTQYYELFLQQGYVQEFKATLRKKNGQLGKVLLSVSSISVYNEACLLYTLHEVTQLEETLTELQSKNDELERFTYTVSHDLKAPLITIAGFTGFLKKDILSGNQERVERNATRIMDAVAKMERLLNELLELSRVGRLTHMPEIVPFRDIVDEALEVTHGRLEAGQIQVKVDALMPSVNVDRIRIVEVVQNLIDNASKFMGAQSAPQIRIGSQVVDGQKTFFVADNGIGIEPVYHEKVFGLFNKLDADTEGTGIGLVLVKRIIEFHGGKIWVESEGHGKGSTFYFTLPIF